jgi:hypothetical protein
MNDVRFDLRIGSAAGADGIRGIAYITDSSEKGPTGFVIVDLSTGQAWRKLDNTDSVKPEPGFLMFAEGRPLYKTDPDQPVKPGTFANDSLPFLRMGASYSIVPCRRLNCTAFPPQLCATETLARKRLPPRFGSLPGRKVQTGWSPTRLEMSTRLLRPLEVF